MKLSVFISVMAWLSVFALAWIMIIKAIPASNVSWGFWVFFLVTALVAGAASYNKPKQIP